MRKKSHISLAKGIIHGLNLEDRITHRYTFYLGSIWPDCIPSFLVKRHCIDDTFELFTKKMEKFVNKYKIKKDMSLASTLRMGVITHYIADYFTFPHNTHYDGNLKEHCIYEEALKHRMRSFIKDVRSETPDNRFKPMLELGEISDYIKNKHSQYMAVKGNTDSDCGYSFNACLKVVYSLLEIVQANNLQVAAC